MKRKLLITFGVVIGIIIIASVAFRIILTRERLIAFVVPRIERTIRAKITIEDIGIRFPFGFGVEVRGLTFDRPLPGGKGLTFTADRVVAKASLMSLIRRKPEIHRVEVRNGLVGLLDAGRTMRVLMEGVSADLSMKPFPEGYQVHADFLVDSTQVAGAGGTQAAVMEDIVFRGAIESDPAFNGFELREGRFEWGELLAVAVSASAPDIRGSGEFSFRLESKDNRLAPLVDAVLRFELEHLVPALEGKVPPKMPVTVSSGALGFAAAGSGNVIRPSAIELEGTVHLDGVGLKHEAVQAPITVAGEAKVAGRTVESGRFTFALGGSQGEVEVGMAPGADGTIDKLQFDAEIAADLLDLQKTLAREGAPMTGKVSAEISGSGAPAVFAALVPKDAGEAAVTASGKAWKRVSLSGTVKAENIALSPPGNPLPISGLNATAELSGGDVGNITADFRLGASPYRVRGSIKQVLPALAELNALSKDPRAAATLQSLLYSIANVPDISLEVKGRSFDARPFSSKQAEKKQPTPRQGAGGEAAPSPLVQNPLAVLLLKNTRFTAGLDSVITERAVLTSVSATGRVRDGIARIDPASFEYAGGTGNATVDVDLRNPERVKTKTKLELDNVQAGQALAPFSRLAALVQGSFSFTSEGEFMSTPGVNPLMTMSATGFASSKGGTVNFAPYVASLAGSMPLDLDRLKNFSYREWSGSFLVKNGRMVTEDWRIRSSSGDWSIAGFFGFDGSIDYAAKLVVPPKLQQSMKDLSKYRDLVDLFRDEQGNIILDFRVQGQASSPKVILDTSRAKQKAGDKLIDELRKKAKDLFK